MRELVGDPDRAPVRVGVSIGDSIAGIYAAFGTVMALFQREANRNRRQPPVALEQRIIDVALNESILSVMESLVPDYLAYGVKRERVGGRMEGIAPSNAYPCDDGTSIIIAGNGDAIYGRYMQTIGRPDLAVDPDLQTNAGRWLRRDELDAAIGEWTPRHSRDEALALLDDAGVPSGPIYTAADICADEQYAARNMIQDFTVDTGGDDRRTVGIPRHRAGDRRRLTAHPQRRPRSRRAHRTGALRSAGTRRRRRSDTMTYAYSPNAVTARRHPARRAPAHRQAALDRAQSRHRPSATRARRAGTRDRVDGPRRSGAADGQHARGDQRTDPGGTGPLLGVGRHTAAHREGRRRRRAQVPVLPVGVRQAQPGQHRPLHRSQPCRLSRRGPQHQQVGGTIELCIATAFTCPFDGTVDPQKVLDIATPPQDDVQLYAVPGGHEAHADTA